MLLHPCISDIANRLGTIQKALRDGTLSPQDGRFLTEGWAYLYKEGPTPVIGMGRSGAADLSSVDDKNATIWFTVTTVDEDRDGDTVQPGGRHGKNYERNPVWFFGHQEWKVPIGTSWTPNRDRVMVAVEENRIRQGCRFDVSDPAAVYIYHKYKNGFLNSTSIAFVPIEAYRKGPRERKDLWSDEDKARTHHDPLMPPGWEFAQWDHTETSGVGVPSNPNANQERNPQKLWEARAGLMRDVLDRESGDMPPKLQKAWGAYSAQARGLWRGGIGSDGTSCPIGWCPGPDGSCVPCDSSNDVTKACSSAPHDEPGEGATPDDTGGTSKEEKSWDIYVDGKHWSVIEAETEEDAVGIAKYHLRHEEPKPKIEARGPYILKRPSANPSQSAPPKQRWNKSLGAVFDQDDVKLEAAPGVGAATTYRVAAKYLNCEIKDLFQNPTRVPSPRMGSFLSGLKHVLSDYRLVEVRNFGSKEYTQKDMESPPTYETLQLNSKQRDAFLVQGTAFYEGMVPVKRGQPSVIYKATGMKGSGPHNLMGRSTGTRFLVKFEPMWSGLNVTVFTRNKDAALNQQLIDKAWVWAKEHNYLKGEAFALSGQFLPRSEEGWDDVFLEEVNRKALKRTLDLFNSKGLSFANRGVILTGPPGTGKTLSSRIIRNQSKGTFIWVSSRDFHAAGSVGGIGMAFEMAKELAPSVICLEDVDNWLHPTTIDLLKTEMDGISRSKGVLTVLTTNFPEKLPDALIDRPGRFHDVLNFDLPTAQCRKQMLSKWLPKTPAKNLDAAVTKTKGYSGAHVYELANFANTLHEHDGLPPTKALEEAIRKVEEQRELITKFQLEGSNYDPLRRQSEDMRPRGMKGLKPNVAFVVEKGHKGCDCADCSSGKPCPCEGSKPAKSAWYLVKGKLEEWAMGGRLQVRKYIRHEGSRWNVYSEAGKRLGSHNTKEDAERQLRAVEANKHKSIIKAATKFKVGDVVVNTYAGSGAPVDVPGSVMDVTPGKTTSRRDRFGGRESSTSEARYQVRINGRHYWVDEGALEKKTLKSTQADIDNGLRPKINPPPGVRPNSQREAALQPPTRTRPELGPGNIAEHVSPGDTVIARTYLTGYGDLFAKTGERLKVIEIHGDGFLTVENANGRTMRVGPLKVRLKGIAPSGAVVHQRRDGKWYILDSNGRNYSGPFHSESDAKAKLQEYVRKAPYSDYKVCQRRDGKWEVVDNFRGAPVEIRGEDFWRSREEAEEARDMYEQGPQRYRSKDLPERIALNAPAIKAALAKAGISARVVEDDRGFAVSVTSGDATKAKKILAGGFGYLMVTGSGTSLHVFESRPGQGPLTEYGRLGGQNPAGVQTRGKGKKGLAMKSALAENSGTTGGYTIPLGGSVCSNCAGTGNCSLCGGTGTKPRPLSGYAGQSCPLCDGSGNCPGCSGTGKKSLKGSPMATRKNTRKAPTQRRPGTKSIRKQTPEELPRDDEQDVEANDKEAPPTDEEVVENPEQEVEDEEHKDAVDEPFNPDPAAVAIAHAHGHAQAEHDWLEKEVLPSMGQLDVSGMEDDDAKATLDKHLAAKAALQQYKDEHVAPRLEHLEGMLGEHFPDQDMDQVKEYAKGLEQQQGGPGENQPGEEGMVGAGDVPPDDASSEPGGDEWADEETTEPEHQQDMALDDNLDEGLQDTFEQGKAEGNCQRCRGTGSIKVGSGSVVQCPGCNGTGRPIAKDEEAPGAGDSDTEEILERYQHPKTGKWMIRKHVGRRASDGRVYLVRQKDWTVGQSVSIVGGDGTEKDTGKVVGVLKNEVKVKVSSGVLRFHVSDGALAGYAFPPFGFGDKIVGKSLSKGETCSELPQAYEQGKGAADVDDDQLGTIKDASEYLSDQADDEEVPKHYRSASKAHSRSLGTVHKALTDAGKVQRDGGSGSPLSDKGSLQRNSGGGDNASGQGGELTDEGEEQTSEGTPGKEIIVGSGGTDETGGTDQPMKPGNKGLSKDAAEIIKVADDRWQNTRRMFFQRTGRQLDGGPN